MFLVRYSDNCFIDAEKITHLAITKDKEVRFYIHSEEGEYIVSEESASMFMNHVQALNGNMDSIESAYVKANKA